jgi:hypothetical protein
MNLTKSYKGVSKRYFIEWFFHVFNLMQDKEDRLIDRYVHYITEFILLDEEEFKHNRFNIQGKKEIIKRMKALYDIDVKLHTLRMFVSRMRKLRILYKDGEGVTRLNPRIDSYLEHALNNREFEINFKFWLKDDTD